MTPSPSSANLKLVADYFDAASAGDADALMATVAPDVRLEVPASLPYGKIYIGRDGIKAALEAFGLAWAKSETYDLRFIADESGRTVVALSTLNGTSRITNQEVAQRVAELFTIQDGKIARIQPFYEDTAALVQVLTTQKENP